MRINKALVTIDYTGQYREEIEAALAPAEIAWCDGRDEEAVKAGLEGANVAILNADLNDGILRYGRDLQWIHCNHAGLNESARHEVFERDLILTGSAGRSGPVLAEHALFFALSLIYRSHAMHEAQKSRLWRGAGNYADDRGLYGKTMGIVGLGYTGRELAIRANAFGMRVIGYDRIKMDVPAEVDTFYCRENGDTIEHLLRSCDIVTLCCRLSDETYHLMNKDTLAMMKPSALLINMARGGVVDSDALLDALTRGVIAGAGSDVFEQEPLPPESPLWTAPNFIITPHCTPEMPDMPARCVEIIKENVRRFRWDEPMLNQLDVRDVYTHGKKVRS